MLAPQADVENTSTLAEAVLKYTNESFASSDHWF